MNKTKTIVFFSGYFLPFLGGIERYTDKLSLELVKLGYQIIIVTSNHANLPDYEVNQGRKIYRLPSQSLFKQRYPLLAKNKTFQDLYTRLLAESVDYVICNTRFQLTTLIGLDYAKTKQVPALVLDHGSSHFTVNNKLLDSFGALYEHALTRRVKAYKPSFFAVSQRSADWLKHFNIQADGVIYNSVADNLLAQFGQATYKEKPDGTLFITYAGRILREKGVEMLLQAFTTARFPDSVQLQIAGDGPILAELKARYHSPQIHFLGKLNYDETMSLLAQTDIFTYPSMYPEGLPTSILEAGLLGCAVIATDRGGTVEVITNADLGLIIEENQQALQSALEDLVAQPAKRQSLQENLQQRVKEHFTWSQTAQHLASVLFKDHTE